MLHLHKSGPAWLYNLLRNSEIPGAREQYQEWDLPETSKRRRVDASCAKNLVLPDIWWPEKIDLITSFVLRADKNGVLLADIIHAQIQSTAARASALISQKQTIVGMGGIGKTTTAIWYANKYEDEYDHVLWIDSEGSALQKSFELLGKKLGLQEFKDSDDLKFYVKEVYQKFSKVKCLFIFDNVEKYDDICKILPSSKQHFSLITSRRQFWGNANELQIPMFQLDVFTPSECMQLLTNTLAATGKGGSEAEMQELGELLGFLPLALQCAVATILKSSSHTLKTYLQRIRQDLKILVDKKKILNEYERSITATLQISIDQIDNDADLEDDVRDWCKKILVICGFCQPVDIPEQLFEMISNSNRFVQDALDQLVLYSLISKSATWSTLYNIHRLLQHVIRQKSITEIERYTTIEYLELLFRPWTNDSGIQSNLAALQDDVLDSHLQCAWINASKEFNEILQAYHELPINLIRYSGLYNHKFIDDNMAIFKTAFRGTDLPIVQLTLCKVCHTREFEANEIPLVIRDLTVAIKNSDKPTEFKSKLELHLKIMAAEIVCRGFLDTFSSNAPEGKYLKLDEFILKYTNLITEIEEHRYTGFLDNVRLIYYLRGYQPTRLPLVIAILFNYAQLLQARLKTPSTVHKEDDSRVLSETAVKLYKLVQEALIQNSMKYHDGDYETLKDCLELYLTNTFKMSPNVILEVTQFLAEMYRLKKYVPVMSFSSVVLESTKQSTPDQSDHSKNSENICHILGLAWKTF